MQNDHGLKIYLESYLQQKDINPRKLFRCLNPAHEDRNPSMSFDPKRNKCHCFGCGVDYDVIDIVGIDYNLTDPRDQFRKARELFGITGDAPPCAPPQVRPVEVIEEKPTEDLSGYFFRAKHRINETDYWRLRGLSSETVERFGLGFDRTFSRGTGGNQWRALIIPTSSSSYTARNTDPNADKANRYRKCGGSPLFNLEALKEDRSCFVVEGEIDAMSICEAGGVAVGLGSTANVQALIRHLKENRPKHPLILALDNSDDGRKAQAELAEGLIKENIFFFIGDCFYSKYKDANEFLVKDLRLFKMAIKAEERGPDARVHLRNSAIFFLDAFYGEDDLYVATPTGFNNLDSALDGGLYPGLYVVGAIPSLGKTTFTLQIADQIAQSGRDVLFFSLEMSRIELMAKSISRMTCLECKTSGHPLIPYAMTARGVRPPVRIDSRNMRDAAISRYSNFADRFFIFEGAGDIGTTEIASIVGRHRAITGSAPVVFVDYLQILKAPHNLSDKQAADLSASNLKRLSRDFDTPVIVVSSFNRMNYDKPVSMGSFKESGGIEYAADVLIGMQLVGVGIDYFNVDAAKRESPRRVDVVILKQRNGVTGDNIGFFYMPMLNHFEERTA